MNRRLFLGSLAAPAAARFSQSSGAKITKILVTPIQGRFHKFVAMNRYDNAPKGHTYETTLVRIATNQGVEGIGVMAMGRNPGAMQALPKLIGADPLALYEMKDGRITGRSAEYADVLSRYRFLDGPLFDLVGKMTGKAAWQLIGESARDKVEVYDGTLYFSDVWFSHRGARAVAEEAEEAQKKGYVGLKLKLGRGFKWMEWETGFRRDVEVVHAVRKAVGPGIKLMVDVNNGFQKQPERAWQLLTETAAADLHFLEEPFVENVERYTQLREKIRAAGLKVLIADGEGTEQIPLFEPFLKPARLIDVVQMDIRSGGFVENRALAGIAEKAGGTSIPHNWASQVGCLMGLHFAKAVRNAPAVEDDRSTCDAIITEGYEFKRGFYTVPDTPGMSIRLNEAVYREKYQAGEEVIS